MDLAFEKDDTPDNPELLFEEEHVEEKYTDDEDALREWDEMNGM